MSDKKIIDPMFIDLAACCCRLDRISNDIHSSLRTNVDRPSPEALDVNEILKEIEQAVTLCGQLINGQIRRKSGSLEPLRGVSFALRAAHEVTEALVFAETADLGRQERKRSDVSDNVRNE